MALDVPDNNPQYDSDEVLRQIMGQGMFPKAPPDGTNVPMRPSTSAPGQPTVPMASADGVTPQQYPTIPKPAPAPVASAVQPPSIANITPGPVQPRLDNPPQMPPAPPAMDPNAVGANGKSKYRMSLGERIAGTAANFLNGFARNGQAAVYVGRGARNQQWNQDQELSEQNRKLYETATQGAYRQGQIEKFEAQGQAATDRANTAEQALKDKTAEFGKTIDEKQREFDNKKPTLEEDAASRTKIADQMGMKKGSKERTTYILTGKMPGQDREQRQPTELETWSSAFRRDNGREPSADEISKRKSNAADKSDQIEKDKDTAMQRAETKAQQRLSNFKIFDPADQKRTPDQRKQSIYDDLEKEKAAAQKEYETRAGQNAQRGKPQSGPQVSPDQAKAFLSQVGWDGKTKPTEDQKNKARELAKSKR